MKQKQKRQPARPVYTYMIGFILTTAFLIISFFTFLVWNHNETVESIRDVTRTAIVIENKKRMVKATLYSQTATQQAERTYTMTATALTMQPTAACYFVWHSPSQEQDTETLPALLDAADIRYESAYTEILWGEDQVCDGEVRQELVMKTTYHVTIAADADLLVDKMAMGDQIAPILAVLSEVPPGTPAEVQIHFQQSDDEIQTWQFRYENAIQAYHYGLRGEALYDSVP